jgi:AAA domain
LTAQQVADLMTARGFDVRIEGDGFRTCCPAHGGDDRNMTIRPHSEGGTICTCHSRHCSRSDIAKAMGLTMSDMTDPRANGNGHQHHAGQRVFPYRDEQGKVLFEVVREPDKRFWQRLPGAEKGGIGDARRVLFGLPELLATNPGDVVAICEGEKCAIAVASLGIASTTNPHGAGKWRPEFTGWLKHHLADRKFLVCADNDLEGKKHAVHVGDSLQAAGLEVYLAELGTLPEKGDVVQWIEAGGTAEKLRTMAAPTVKTKREIERAEERRIITAPDLMSKTFAPLQWAVPKLIPEGLTIFAGGTKTGKSWLSLHIAIAISCGGAVFGQIPVEKGEVLLLALEDSHRRLQDRLGKLLRGEPAPPGLHLVTHWPLLGEGFSELLDEWLTEHPACRFVCVDVLQKIRPQQKTPGVDYGADYLVTNALQQVPREHRVAMCVIHHTRKMVASDPIDMVSGSVGITGGADSILVLMRPRDQKDATLHTISREADVDAMALLWDPELCQWNLVGKAADHQLCGEKKQVIDFLMKSTTPVTPAELAGVIGKNSHAIQYLLGQLADEGRCERMGRGKYAMNEMQRSVKHW